jgi:ABC-type glycerol-3-phosphate transport system substrate-binding protein
VRAVIAFCALAACAREPAPTHPIKFLHTFNPRETELFNTTIAERGWHVDASLVPFARGHQVIEEMLRAGKDCPDLIRIDATWLPGLVAAKLLAQPPAELQNAGWSDLAHEMAVVDNKVWAVPQSIDGLVVVRLASTPAPATPTIAALLTAAHATATAGLSHPLGVRVDGYWFVPWLRADGVELAPAQIASDGAVSALRDFAALFGGLAAEPPSAGSEAPDELRRWNAHEIAYWVTGPWQLADLRDRDQIEVSALEHAPRGGQLLVVPTCAQQPSEGWRLAKELTSEPVSLIFSDAFATVPTLEVAQAHATALVQRTLAALKSAERLPRTSVTPLLFDDLNPAVAAVVFGDATPEEAIAGVRRSWHRLETDE